MTSAVLMDRGALACPPAFGQPAAAPAASWCVVPQCEIKVSKCKGGLKIECCCDDEVACGTLHNLCRMLSSGQCSICCQMNGVTVCECKLSCGICKCECTEDGCCITCCSGDEACCKMLQACCDAIACCQECGCSCYVCFNGTPICCCC